MNYACKEQRPCQEKSIMQPNKRQKLPSMLNIESTANVVVFLTWPFSIAKITANRVCYNLQPELSA